MILPEGVELVRTCDACPEQYDMLLYGERVGYFRLRHSYYSVEVPGPSLNPEDRVLEEDYLPGQDAGIFDPEHREAALLRGVWAVLERLQSGKTLP